MSGAHICEGGTLISLTLPYSDSFQRRLLSVHSCRKHILDISKDYLKGNDRNDQLKYSPPSEMYKALERVKKGKTIGTHSNF